MTDTVTRRDLLGTGLVSGGIMGAGRAVGQASELANLTLQEASERIREGTVSPVTLTESCLSKIERIDPKLNAFITVTAEPARAQARQLESEQRRGKLRGPLHGIPLALKDLIDVAGVRTTAASALHADRIPSADAEVVRRLKQQGAILLGKLNMDEFAYNFTSETSYFGPIHNPWDLARTPGGSSGGSAAAVAARLCFGALGSDTGGSIRQPAAFCNIAGLKPTFGLVSTTGVFPLAWSLDHVGPMCRTVTDTAMLLQAIAGYDSRDTNSLDVPVPDYVAGLNRDTSALRLGVPRAVFYEGLDPEIAAAVDDALRLLGTMTASTQDVELPAFLPLPRVLGCEAYAYHEPHILDSPESYHPMTRQSILGAARRTMPEYARGRRKLDRLRRDVGGVFSDVDLLITPTVPAPPILLEEGRVPDLILLRNAIPMNLFDLPTISIPCGFTSAGLPIGLQISGPRLSERTVFALALAYEQATVWHKRFPDV
jgi:aspartyl-tRNA(Asn)/glutamyl-tRNA(Gln) amidotransferase subunit A